MEDAEQRATEHVFQALFEQEFTYVWNALRRLGIGEADREDLAQEVFVRVHKALPTYDATRPARPWLFAFAFRVASDFRRLERNQAEIPQAPEIDVAATDPTPHDFLDASQRRARLHRALDALDLDKRAVLVLHEMACSALVIAKLESRICRDAGRLDCDAEYERKWKGRPDCAPDLR